MLMDIELTLVVTVDILPLSPAGCRHCFLLESLTVRQEMLSTIPPSTLSAAPVVALAWGEAA